MPKNSDQNWKDISVPLDDSTHCWPGTPNFRIEELARMNQGENHNLSAVRMSLHFGTHLDAPYHFLESGSTIEELPDSLFFGSCKVIRVNSTNRRVGPSAFNTQEIRGIKRLILKTGNSQLYQNSSFQKNFKGLTPVAAEFLAEHGVQLVGIDYLSIGPYGEVGNETHRSYFQTGGKTVLETLDLADVKPGVYQLSCFPLSLTGVEGSPARAMIRPQC